MFGIWENTRIEGPKFGKCEKDRKGGILSSKNMQKLWSQDSQDREFITKVDGFCGEKSREFTSKNAKHVG